MPHERGTGIQRGGRQDKGKGHQDSAEETASPTCRWRFAHQKTVHQPKQRKQQ